MFPFWGPLRNVSAKNAYSQHDVQNINKWAAQNELMVIPLVQTFGHLEFILKLDEFKDLREVPLYPQSICPSQDRSWDVVQEVIDQVVYFILKEISYIIGIRNKITFFSCFFLHFFRCSVFIQKHRGYI